MGLATYSPAHSLGLVAYCAVLPIPDPHRDDDAP